MRSSVTIKNIEVEKALVSSRASILFALACLFVLALLARFFQLQVIEHEVFSLRSDENRIRVAPLTPPRGLIFDRNGRLLAENVTASSLGVIPEKVGSLEATVQDLKGLLKLKESDLESFAKNLQRPRTPGESVEIVDSLSDRQLAILAVNRHIKKGLEVSSRLVRNYPLAELSAHAVGSVRRITQNDLRTLEKNRYRGTRFVGRRGVEAFYEDRLMGQVGFQTIETDAHGRIKKVIDKQQAVVGKDLHMYLDAELQVAAYNALGNFRGAVVAIEPETGGILAMVSKPGYDPNIFVTGFSETEFEEMKNSVSKPFFNRAAEGQYAPGSTFKPIVGLGGISFGLMDWDTIIDDRGTFSLPGRDRVYRDWAWTPKNPGGQGKVDLRRAIYRSSNIYFYDVASRMDIGRLAKFTEQFGYGKKLISDFPSVVTGLVPNEEWKLNSRAEKWYQGDSVNLGIGQGDLLVTPVQVAYLAATIANRGELVDLRMVKSAPKSASVDAREYSDIRSRQVTGLTPLDWERMAGAMEDVVHLGGQGYGNNGTAWAYIGQNIPYRMAGKSGTAQVVEISQGEEYDEDVLSEFERKHAWFMAFAPTHDPKIALAVLVENGGGGSSVAGPIARKIIDSYLVKDLYADKSEYSARFYSGPADLL